MIQIKNMTKAYGKQAVLKGLSLEVFPGESLALLGVNGAGKSTLIKILSGLIPFDSGEVLMEGQPRNLFFGQAANKAKVGIVPQETALYDTLTVAQNISFWGRLYGLSQQDINGRMRYYLGLLDLEDTKGKKLQDLSIGQQKIISLLCGILHEPSLLFLDEPTVGIDMLNKEKIYTFIHELKKKQITIIYTTHNFSEIPRICDRVAILKNGVISDLGTEQELIAQYHLHHSVEVHLETPVTDTNELPVSLLAFTDADFQLKDRTCLAWYGAGVSAALPSILGTLQLHGIRVTEIKINQPTLENIFIEAHH